METSVVIQKIKNKDHIRTIKEAKKKYGNVKQMDRGNTFRRPEKAET